MEHLISIAIVALTALAVYAIIRSNPARRAPPMAPLPPYAPQAPATAPARHWSDAGRFQVELQIESQFHPVLRELAGEHGEPAAATPCLAILLPDLNNPYDNFAVPVFVAGRLAGYLAPKDAALFRQRLNLHQLAGQPTSCDAQVRGGARWNDKRLSYVLALDLEPFF